MTRMFPAMVAAMTALPAVAENRIDVVRPDAPELAAIGDHIVGVRTLTFTNPDQVDILNTGAEGEVARYDRSLTVEVWYPAADGTTPGGTYDTVLRDGVTQTTLTGRAARDASPAADNTFPLVIISHGYPGNRFLMAHLGENIASKGYVVASIDHTDSTYSDQSAFGSTLYNRPWDQRFVVDQMESLDDDLGALVQDGNAAVVGYSMGGYGALIYAGAGVTQESLDFGYSPPQQLLARNLSGSDSHASLSDDRIKAFVAIGPWGNNSGFFSPDTLAAIDSPLMLIAGEIDDVSIYDAMRGIFDDATGTDRHLLTFQSANHNAGAPMPAPAESYAPSPATGEPTFGHYADAVWDNVRMNNITQHFVTAWLDQHLKGIDRAAYFDLVPNAQDGVWDRDDAGNPTEADTYWTGFPNRTAAGLTFETKRAGE
ncbi:alpha/beta fold hydrolase [Loktanella sp. TSTF-M6]|uniref:Alpha/beta fold hydrolase n=1 Tax=Loktanella gaetbuli TaxID=2881335 RepID=A0ABS8BVE9_9RHOB|nr:alpha/beta fold hydrolase [Loktanella gaetbuli]MCB5199574.1 alpha/beta fold hydrolase [Loktanella gaetbuli]